MRTGDGVDVPRQRERSLQNPREELLCSVGLGILEELVGSPLLDDAAIGNDQVILVKDTSLLTVLAVPEIISVFRNVNSNQLDAWTPIVLVSVAYLAITLPLGKLVRTMERRAEWGETDG